MRVFFGFRLDGKCHVYQWDTSCPRRPERVGMLGQAQGLECDGPDWGYHGSGPAALAYTLVCHVTRREDVAADCFEYIHEMVTSRLHKECWSLTSEQVMELCLRWEVEINAEVLLTPSDNEVLLDDDLTNNRREHD